MKKIVLVPMIILMLTIVGCVPNISDSARTKMEGTGVGLLGGALIGRLVGGKRGAKLGAVVGAGAGLLYGAHVADQKEKYAKKEDWLNASILSAKKVNRKVRLSNARFSKKIAQTKKLVKLYKKRKISKEKMRRQHAIVVAERKKAQKLLRVARRELQAQKRVLREARKMGRPSHAKRLAQQIAQLKRQNSSLQNKTNTLASLSALTAV